MPTKGRKPPRSSAVWASMPRPPSEPSSPSAQRREILGSHRRPERSSQARRRASQNASRAQLSRTLMSGGRHVCEAVGLGGVPDGPDAPPTCRVPDELGLDVGGGSIRLTGGG